LEGASAVSSPGKRTFGNGEPLPSNPNPNGCAVEIDAIPRRARPNSNARGYGPAYASAVRSSIDHFHSSQERWGASAATPANVNPTGRSDETDGACGGMPTAVAGRTGTGTDSSAGTVPVPTGLATVERRPVEARYHFKPPPRAAWADEPAASTAAASSNAATPEPALPRSQQTTTTSTGQAHGHIVDNVWQRSVYAPLPSFFLFSSSSDSIAHVAHSTERW